jgi:hypothetical protein
MRQSIVLLAITSSFFAACLTEPDDELGSSTDELRGTPVHTVSGGGQVQYPDGFGLPPGYAENYGFSARQRADGSVDGQIELQWDPPYDFKAHGEVSCLHVDGNSAYLGFTITHSDNPAFGPGVEGVFEVQDHGSGAGAAPDTISFFLLGFPLALCDQFPPGAFGAFDWTHGNVTVR